MLKDLFIFPTFAVALALRPQGLWKQVLICFFISAKQVTRDYDEEEQGYDSEKEKKEEKKMADSSSPKVKESAAEKGSGESARESKVNGDDHHEEDMDMSDWSLPLQWTHGCRRASVSFLCDSFMLYLLILNPRCIQLHAIHGL